jgi:hypothetical protein
VAASGSSRPALPNGTVDGFVIDSRAIGLAVDSASDNVDLTVASTAMVLHFMGDDQ